MTHSFKTHFFHVIWSTKDRHPWITSEVQSQLYPYMGGIIRNYNAKSIEIGGMPDHVHLLVMVGTLDKYTPMMRDVKASSSQWIHKNFPELKGFTWQKGFGSFSVSYSCLESVKKYIKNQAKHHAKMTYETEFIRFLKLHNVDFDPRFLF